MRLLWTRRSLADLDWLFGFLCPKSVRAAAAKVSLLRQAALKLLTTPRLGERVEDFTEREVRRIFVADYELRYEIDGDEIRILRVWHTRENR